MCQRGLLKEGVCERTLVRGDKATEVLQQGLMCVAKGIVWMILTLYALAESTSGH